MAAIKDITGQRFGRLVVLEIDAVKRRGRYHWLCQCDCGTKKSVCGNDLRKGNNRSCGCLLIHTRKNSYKHSRGVPANFRHQTHGLTNSAAYRSWCSMLSRCRNKNYPKYKSYGARGITVCDRWLKFENFYADMGERPAERTIDRIDNDGNYEPGNCRWATAKEQANNKRRR